MPAGGGYGKGKPFYANITKKRGENFTVLIFIRKPWRMFALKKLPGFAIIDNDKNRLEEGYIYEKSSC
jgi:hypothetical protein